jgi:hypothetical protein
MKGCYNIRNPKRLPRKLKKYLIKTWDRKCYRGIMKGYIILVPWIIVEEKPTILGYQGFDEKLFERYLKKEINPKYYGKINTLKFSELDESGNVIKEIINKQFK